MDGPGRYEPDSIPGIKRTEDLPKPKIIRKSRNFKRQPCPECGHRASWVGTVQRTLHDLGDPRSARPCDILLVYSQHHPRPGRCRQNKTEKAGFRGRGPLARPSMQ